MSEAQAVPTRRDRFRRIIARLDGSDDPTVAVSEGLCLPRPDGVIERLTASLEIRPNGSHLVVGSVGSGKTTALLTVKGALKRRAPELRCFYLDLGHSDELDSDLYFQCSTAKEYALEGRRVDIFLVDGLDRTLDVDHFRNCVGASMADFAANRQGLVVVGPPQLQVDPPSLEGDWFDQTLVCGAVDTDTQAGWNFLRNVIEHRAGDFFEGPAIELLVRRSGGVLRDLILLSRQSVESAYVRGAEQGAETDVKAASWHLGQSLLRGTSRSTVERMLSAVEAGGEVNPGRLPLLTQELNELVLRRVLIPSAVAPVRYRIHPSIVPIVEDLAP